MRATERFSNRVADYVKYRPSYPDAVFEAIDRHAVERGEERSRSGLPRMAAELGSGTGIFTRGLLTHGWSVHAVEPNREMRLAAEAELGGEAGFVSHATSAEATGLSDESVALVVAAQAFHWFDVARCRLEWRRILLPDGFVCLVWNVRKLGSPFMDEYEQTLTRLLPEYSQVTMRHVDDSALRELFVGPFETETCPNQQRFDWTALVGRIESSSYAPKPGEPLHEPLMTALEAVFARHQRDGLISFEYETRAIFGDV